MNHFLSFVLLFTCFTAMVRSVSCGEDPCASESSSPDVTRGHINYARTLTEILETDIVSASYEYDWSDLSEGTTTMADIQAQFGTAISNLVFAAPLSATASGNYNVYRNGRALAANPDESLGLYIVRANQNYGGSDGLTVSFTDPIFQFCSSIGDYNEFRVNANGETIRFAPSISAGDYRCFESDTPISELEITLLPDQPIANWVIPSMLVVPPLPLQPAEWLVPLLSPQPRQHVFHAPPPFRGAVDTARVQNWHEEAVAAVAAVEEAADMDPPLPLQPASWLVPVLSPQPRQHVFHVPPPGLVPFRTSRVQCWHCTALPPPLAASSSFCASSAFSPTSC
jgi:hypothetical protein